MFYIHTLKQTLLFIIGQKPEDIRTSHHKILGVTQDCNLCDKHYLSTNVESRLPSCALQVLLYYSVGWITKAIYIKADYIWAIPELSPLIWALKGTLLGSKNFFKTSPMKNINF